MLRKALFIIIFIPILLVSKEIKGVVYGVGEDGKDTPLKRASLQILDTQIGTFTNDKGEFKLDLPNKSNRVISRFVGYENDTTTVENTSDLVVIRLKTNITTDAVKVEANLPASIISHSEIVKSEMITSKGLQKAACCNLAESFVTNASVDVEYTDAVSGARQIQLLGLHGSYSQILVENIPNLRGIASRYGLGYIPGPWMESISISKGTASVVNGFESISGQINVALKKPETSAPFFGNMFVDDMGRVEASVDGAYKLSPSTSTMLLLHSNMLQNPLDMNHDSFIDHPLVQQFNAINRWNYAGEIHESVSGVNVLFENRNGGQSDFVNSKNPDFYGFDVKTERVHLFTKNGFIIPTEMHQSIGTIISGTYHKQNSFYGKNTYNAKQNSLYVNLLYQAEFNEDNNLTTGLSYQYDNYDETYKNLNYKTEESIPGIFAEYGYNGFKDLTLVGGIRVDNHNDYGTFITPRMHIKYSIDDVTTIRLSAGKGFRSAIILAENAGIMASSRDFTIESNLRLEEAVNYGLNFITEFDFWGIYYTLNVDFYRTDFINQVVVDLDRSPDKAYFYNLEGESYSNAFQVDLIIEPLVDFVITTAYRMNDVRMTYNNQLLEKPLVSKHKGFLNLSYSFWEKSLNLDYTIEYNGGGRLPNTSSNPEEYRLDETYPEFIQMHAQITKKFSKFDLYIGAENLTDYKQHHPILAAKSPFSQYFDSSMIWGPISGAKFYLGFRLNLYN